MKHRPALRIKLTSLFGLIALGLGTAVAQEPPIPAPFVATVTNVVDGDGLYVQGQALQLRLWGVDAPEMSTTAGKKAEKALQSLVAGKTVRVEVQAYQPPKDDYKARWVARVWMGDVEVNRRLIETGPAKEFCRFSKGIYGHC